MYSQEDWEDPGRITRPYVPGSGDQQTDYGIVSSAPLALKLCDLCSSPNLATAAECTVCGWHGHFSAIEPQGAPVFRSDWQGPVSITPQCWLAMLRRRFAHFRRWLEGA